MASLFHNAAAEPLEQVLSDADRRLQRAAEQNVNVPESIRNPILVARDALQAKKADQNVMDGFYTAYSALTALTGGFHANDNIRDPFLQAVDDAEYLLKYGAEMAVEVPREVAANILAARTSIISNGTNNEIRIDFYSAYSKLAGLLEGATVSTIQNCSSRQTRRTLARNRILATLLAFFIAIFSVCTFITEDMSKRIDANVVAVSEMAAKLRTGITVVDEKISSYERYVNDPCDLITKPSDKDERQVRGLDDVTQLQHFAATIRDLHSLAVKLNSLASKMNLVVWRVECDPYGNPCPKDNGKTPKVNSDKLEQSDEEKLKEKENNRKNNSELQLNPTIINYPAEVLCKIQTTQKVRSFANNVQGSYKAAVGAVAAYMLPMLYALLGAYAFRLRLFGETIRKRTYHPSFADSARMITAVIAGAIVSLFYPAQGASLSPLAIAFLVGYGVELFFKFLDGLINSFNSGFFPGQRAKPPS